MTNLVLQAAAGGSSMSFLIMMVAIFAIMWFFMIRPQQKKQKEIRKFQNALAEGTKVVTGGGVYGTVKRVDLEANTVAIETAKTAKLFGIDPKVAVLSFSTKGSGKGGTVALSHDAVIKAQEMDPELAVDGVSDGSIHIESCGSNP